MPNRIIKDSIRTSDTINNLSDFAFRAWTYLITYADDYGRGSADLDVVKGMVFPKVRVSHKKIEAALQELHNSGTIQLYEVEGKRYFEFANWKKHQIPRAKISRYPAPLNANDCNCMQMHANDMDTRKLYSNTILDNYTRKLYSNSYKGNNTLTADIDPAEQREKLKTALLAIEEGGA